MQFCDTLGVFLGLAPRLSLLLVAPIVVLNELLAGLQGRPAHHSWHLFIPLLELLVPVLSDLTLDEVLLIVELAVLLALWVQPLKLIVDIGKLVGECFLLNLDLCHHLFELLLSLDPRLILDLLVSLEASAQLVAILKFRLLPHLILGLLAALLAGLDAAALQIRNWPVVEEVQGFTDEDQLAAQARNKTDAWVVQEVEGCDFWQSGHEWYNVVRIVDHV